MTYQGDIVQVIIPFAKEYGIDVPVALSLCETESSLDPWAWNPEPQYRYLWNIIQRKPFRALTVEEIRSEIPPQDFPAYPGVPRDTEWWGQQASWGLAQIMGAVAREYGFLGRYLSELCNPTVSLPLAFKHLRHYLERYGDMERALEAYNGGPGMVGKNISYAKAVLDKRDKWSNLLA